MVSRSRRDSVPPSSFSLLYSDLLSMLCEQHLGLAFGMLYIPGATLFLIFFVAFLSCQTIRDPLPTIAYGFYLLVFFVFLSFFLFAFIEIAVVGTRNPHKQVNELVARLLTVIPVPYRERQGLTTADIERLKDIAEVDQAAADWRGSYVSIIIIGAIGFLFGAFTVSIDWLIENMPITVDALKTTDVENLVLILLIGVAWAVVAFLAIWLGGKLFSYLQSFLATESANRTILLACQEAIAVLEANGLSDKDHLSITDRAKIAKSLNYKLIECEQLKHLPESVGILHEGKEGWVLISNEARGQVSRRYERRNRLAKRCKTLKKACRKGASALFRRATMREWEETKDYPPQEE